MSAALFNILVFPGFIFLSVFGLIAEFVDRKLYARMQNRIGPPWFQPLADIIKLTGKEAIIPREADKRLFKLLPIFALASSCTAFMYVPIWGTKSLFPFEGDIIVALYFLTIPTITFFLAGWSSSSLFASLGSVRALTQLFAYEVPLFMALLGPAMLAGSWSLSGISAFYYERPALALLNLPGLLVALVAIQGKLERVPFDIPEAETEIVGGAFTEYSGRLLAIFRMAIDVEMVVVSGIVAAVFIPLFVGSTPIVAFLLFIIKTLFIVFLLTVMRTALARLRIDQMVSFCWKYLTPAALLQIVIDLLAKGALL